MSDQDTIFHYTDAAGFKAISSQVDWTFKATQPPGNREFGAYFTDLRLDANRFAARTRIPVAKREFIFIFTGTDGLRPMRGERGKHVLLSPIDYVVAKNRQVNCGETCLTLGILKEDQ